MDRPILSLSLKKDMDPSELSSYTASIHHNSLIESGFIAEIDKTANISPWGSSIKSILKKSNSDPNMKKNVRFN